MYFKCSVYIYFKMHMHYICKYSIYIHVYMCVYMYTHACIHVCSVTSERSVSCDPMDHSPLGSSVNGSLCKSMADSCQCMAKTTTIL